MYYNMEMRTLRIVILLLVIGTLFFAFRYFRADSPQQARQTPTPTPTIIQPIRTESRTSLFVPYWSLGVPLSDEYDRLIYFGVTPNNSGINTQEVGYVNLQAFLDAAPTSSEKDLTLRMLDNTQNFAVLEDTKLQQKIIAATTTLAREKGFTGVVLDLELNALPFDSLLQQINTFTASFNQAAHRSKLKFAVTMYGDAFYRVRPFDVATMAKNSDEVMIMAYDFHKANGNPGPNFPLNGYDQYGYDFTQMTEGFMKAVPSTKLTVIFGYFGYDWPTDEKGKAVNRGAAFSVSDIRRQYLQGCATCIITRDALSSETKISYTSDDNVPHIVWFEDELSIRKKEEYLKAKGISSYSYWAHSYF